MSGQTVADTPQTYLSAILVSLTGLHGLESRRAEILDIFTQLTTESLCRYPGANRRRLSTFTSDGLPFELSLSLGERTSGGLRYGTEAGDLRATLKERLNSGHETISRLLVRIGAAPCQYIHQSLFEAIFPEQILFKGDYRFGMWQGMVHRAEHGDTLKVYYNLRTWGQGLSIVLDKILSVLRFDLDTQQLREMAHRLPEDAQTVFLGMDYSADGRLRAKIYHRCQTAIQTGSIKDLLAANGMEAHSPAAKIFFRNLAGSQGELPPRSLLIHVGLDALEQDPVLGLYVVLNRFFYGDKGAHKHIVKLLEAFDMSTSLYEQTLQVIAGHGLPGDAFRHHTLLGFGVSRRAFKVNIYLRPLMEIPHA